MSKNPKVADYSSQTEKGSTYSYVYMGPILGTPLENNIFPAVAPETETKRRMTKGRKTERRMSERRMSEHRMTERRMTERRMTKRRITEGRKLPKAEKNEHRK